MRHFPRKAEIFVGPRLLAVKLHLPVLLLRNSSGDRVVPQSTDGIIIRYNCTGARRAVCCRPTHRPWAGGRRAQISIRAASPSRYFWLVSWMPVTRAISMFGRVKYSLRSWTGCIHHELGRCLGIGATFRGPRTLPYLPHHPSTAQLLFAATLEIATSSLSSCVCILCIF